MVVEFQVDPDKSFQKAIKKATKEVGDLTVPLTLISQQWFKSNRAIFDLSGPGKFKDLSTAYKPQKKAAVGFIYPILRRTGAMERSITVPGSPGSISKILNKNTLTLGSSVPYAQFNQKSRPFILIGAEQTAPPELNKRLDAWIAILANYVEQKTSKNVGS